MNCTTYIFGELSSGYTQYPDDSASNIFKSAAAKCTAPTQLIIHRDESLMYYIYIRKINYSSYIGLAVVVNGYYFTDIHNLFSLFETEIECLVNAGIIINFTSDGELTSSLTDFRCEEEESTSVVTQIQEKASALKCIMHLPPTDYSISTNTQKTYRESDKSTEIAEASCKLGFTIILKEDDYDTLRFRSYSSTLKRLNQENNDLLLQNKDLKEANDKITKEKKQFKNVILLCIVVLLCVIGISLLNSNLNQTRDKLNSANDTIAQQNEVITDYKSRVSSLKDSLESKEKALSKETRLKIKAEETLTKISTTYPFIVTQSEVNSERIKLDYYCPTEKQVTVTLKAINLGSSETITNSHTFTCTKGSGSNSLYFYRALNTSHYYYILIIYNGRVIAGKYW